MQALRIVWVKVAVLAALATQLVVGSPYTLPSHLASVQAAYNDSAFIITESGELQLKLCECERAAGAPNGLSCDKAGWFVSSWERQGQWVTPFSIAGSGTVPLSHAICCRPCLPSELPPDSSGRIPSGEKPVAVVSLACHVSTDETPGHCEVAGSSLVAGFSESVQVFSAADTNYPVNAARCCTPSLLLSNGDAWELERCACSPGDPGADPSVSCGGTNTHRLLAGYADRRATPLGQSVPVAPADCCALCLSRHFHPMSQCDDLANCNERGVCNLGACDCFQGWAGPDCSARDARGGRGRGVPGWAITLIVLAGLLVASLFILVGGHVLNLLGERVDAAAGLAGDPDSPRAPLLIRIDAGDAGSVGSQDSDSDASDAEDGQLARRIAAAIHTLNTGAPGGLGGGLEASDAGPGTGEDGPRRSPSAGPQDDLEGGTLRTVPPAQTADPGGPDLAAAPDSAAAPHAAAAQAPGPPAAPYSEGPASGIATKSAAQGTRGGCSLGRDCAVCMVRECQVVLVPCGHTCLCRRCSRKLQRCPICRKDIARRQRLFL
ncbi:hypothetical protein ACKKBG_A34460 [Auxenochlorella protothecoides x Auxenochlorella symbiontica]